MAELRRFYKDWAIPGPVPPGAAEIPTEVEGDPAGEVTLDALSGHFRIHQLRKGHRFSTDDLLTAWYGTVGCPSPGRVLDLGSGIGSVGMIAAWRLPGSRFITVEAQETSVRLARRSAKLNGIEDRYEIRQGDFRDPSVFAADEKFDLVLGSPPYFPLDAGVLGNHEQKIACRFEVRGDVSDYCRTASERLAQGGYFACIFPVNPVHQEKRVEDGARAAGLTILRRRDIVLREGEPPLLAVFGMARSADLPPAFRDSTAVWREPPLTIRMKDGSVHPEYSVVKLSIGFPP